MLYISTQSFWRHSSLQMPSLFRWEDLCHRISVKKLLNFWELTRIAELEWQVNEVYDRNLRLMWRLIPFRQKSRSYKSDEHPRAGHKQRRQPAPSIGQPSSSALPVKQPPAI